MAASAPFGGVILTISTKALAQLKLDGRGRDYERRRGGYSPRDSPRGTRGINDRWKHDKFEEEEEKRTKSDRWGNPRRGRNHYHQRFHEDEEMDEEEHQMERDFSPGRRKKYQKPTNIIYMKGLPADVTEADIYQMVESLEDTFTLQAVRLGRDRLTGASRGFGFIEFPTIEDSKKFMESPVAADLQIREHPLWTNYSSAPTPGHRPGHEGVHMDWMCNMCAAINFARRLECYQCCAPRGKDVQRISNEPMGPSNILKVSCLDPHTSENDLNALFSALVPIKEIRMVMDKFTNAPRGFAFIHFFSVADASRAMNTFQGCTTETQLTPIKLFYAKDRVPPMATGTAAAAAIEAAQAMQQYNASWEPKEFDEAAAEVDETPEPAPEAAPTQQNPGNGFVYDTTSGYYYHEATGYYYDANSGMYYNGATQEWLMYDASKNTYVPYVAPEATPTPKTEPTPKPKAVKRATAVIGAKPQLNAQSVAAAARAEQEEELRVVSFQQLQKEKEQRAIGAEKLLGNSARVATALRKSAKAEALKNASASAPRVKGVIRGGKWSGGLQNDA